MSTLHRLLAAALLATTWPSFADDTAPTAAATELLAPAADPLAVARQHVASQKWAAATEELQRVNATNNADWNNLMGFSLRKNSPPDLEGSERFYTEALRLDPQHRGALEYSGELYLMKGDLPRAEARLAALGQACPTSCGELRHLKRAVERFKSAGNKVTAGNSGY